MESEDTVITKEVIAEEDDFKIVSYKHAIKSEKLIITFDAHGHGIRDKGFGSDMSLNSGFDHIFISHKFNSQYQGLTLEVFKRHVAPIINDYEVYTYGSSLGGYCAIYYGGCVNAKAIALSPRNSAHHSIRANAFAHIEFSHLNIVDTPRSSYPPLIIYDPKQEIDSRFLHDYILPAYEFARLVEMPFAGHLIAEALLEVGLLKDYILSIINNDSASAVDFSEHKSSYWNAEIAYEKLKSDDYFSAAYHLKKSLTIRHNEIHLDQLVFLTKKHKIPLSFLYGVIHPYLEILEASDLFDGDWYLSQNTDIQNDTGFTKKPSIHYLLFGGYEGRNPSEKFESAYYLRENPDVAAFGANPLLHYLRLGKAEGRRPCAQTE